MCWSNRSWEHKLLLKQYYFHINTTTLILLFLLFTYHNDHCSCCNRELWVGKLSLLPIKGLIAITFFNWQSATSAVSKSNCLSVFFLINCLSHSLENYSRQSPRWKWDAYLAQKDVKGYWVSCIINFMHSNCLKNCLWKNSHTQKWYQSQFARWPP